MMHVLRIARDARLPDWMIGAGFVRNKIWDVLHEYFERTPLADVDLIYFDPKNKEETTERAIEQRLREKDATVPWSVKNQARMHVKNGDSPYSNSTDALSRWVETPTCVAVRLEDNDRLTLIAPHGIRDLVSLEVRMSPGYSRDPQHYTERVKTKRWEARWQKLKIYY